MIEGSGLARLRLCHKCETCDKRTVREAGPYKD